MSPADVDALYLGFVETLDRDVQPAARELAFRLGLARTPDATWASVFRHELTLGAPALFAEALPGVPPASIREAVLGHLLAVLEVCTLTRIGTAGADRAPELRAILQGLSGGRRRVMERFGPGAVAAHRMARAKTLQALDEERQFRPGLKPASFEQYRSIALAKQSVGFSASLALAQIAGASQRVVRAMDRTLRSAWLAVQFEHDALCWEDDWRQGGAWAVSLACGMRSSGHAGERPTEPDLLRRGVLATGVLGQILSLCRLEFRAASRRACALGAPRLSAWAREREQQIGELLRYESRSAGYAVRVRKLVPWALEVFR
jgi:hypothetical protein